MGQLDRRRNYLAHRYAYQKHDLHSELQHSILPDYGSRNRWHSDSPKRLEKQRYDRLGHGKASHRLQLHRLDWERNRLLLGDE